jgi:hypothetical protein
MQIFKTYKLDSQWNNKGIVQYVHQLICDFQQHISQQHLNNLIWIFPATLSEYFCSYTVS